MCVGREVVRQGDDPELDMAARRLTQGAISRLSLEDRSHLMRRMDTRENEQPAFFVCSLAVDGPSWALCVEAHANGCAASISVAEGALQAEAQQAA